MGDTGRGTGGAGSSGKIKDDEELRFRKGLGETPCRRNFVKSVVLSSYIHKDGQLHE